MYSETYKIAEHNIRICSLYDEVHTLCKDYQHNEYTDFTVEIKQQDIDFERRKSFDENILVPCSLSSIGNSSPGLFFSSAYKLYDHLQL